jgi:hypothetical protein
MKRLAGLHACCALVALGKKLSIIRTIVSFLKQKKYPDL